MRCISDEISGVRNTMNGDFGKNSNEIVFMGISEKVKDWHIYKYNLTTKKLTDLTPGNKYCNEDPKYSADGKKIVYKQGRWDGDRRIMIYDIVVMRLSDKKKTKLTNDKYENSMPYFSTDGKKVYYARGDGENSKIYSVSTTKPYKIAKVYSAKNICSYYPITYGKNTVYFSRWYSSQNGTDKILKLDTKTRKVTTLKFNRKAYDCSDACPVNQNYMIFSSTKSKGKGKYDLYIANLKTGTIWSLNKYNQQINNSGHQLGASYCK